jgi:hypothetical protein
MAVAEELLNFPDIDAGIEEQGSGGGAHGMGAVEPHPLFDRFRQPGHITGNHAVHAGLAHSLFAQFSAVHGAPRPENRPRV